MKDTDYKKLKEKELPYIEEEFLLDDSKQLLLFRGADEAIAAIQRNEIPGITWTSENQRKWDADQLEQTFNNG